MSNPNLTEDVKKLIITSLKLDKAPADIADDEPLFGGGLGLDSIDALELAVAIERTYRVTRGCLEVLLEAGFSPVILTRGARVVEDLDLLARFLDRRFRFPTIGMAAAGGVTKVFAEMGNHDLGHAGVYRCGGGVVEINGIGVGSGVHRDTLLGGI